MAWRHDLFHVAVFACPADPPFIHLANSIGPLAAQDRGEFLVAQPAAGVQRVGQMMGPVVRGLFADGNGHCHLRHDRRTPASDQAFVEQQHAGTVACGGDGGVHSRAAGTHHQYVGFEMYCFVCHGGIVPDGLLWNNGMEAVEEEK